MQTPNALWLQLWLRLLLLLLLLLHTQHTHVILGLPGLGCEGFPNKQCCPCSTPAYVHFPMRLHLAKAPQEPRTRQTNFGMGLLRRLSQSLLHALSIQLDPA